jgi:hypothetical protein
MKQVAAFLLLSFFISSNLFAQDIKIPELPETKDEFIKSEPDFINVANWLENKQVGPDMQKRTLANAYVIAWLTNSPTVTVTVREKILKGFDKNAQLLSVFMGGYAKYCLMNNYSKDELKCNVAGLRSVINCYNLGGDLKKDKALLKIIGQDKEGKLEDWVKEAMQ